MQKIVFVLHFIAYPIKQDNSLFFFTLHTHSHIYLFTLLLVMFNPLPLCSNFMDSIHKVLLLMVNRHRLQSLSPNEEKNKSFPVHKLTNIVHLLTIHTALSINPLQYKTADIHL